MNLRQKPLIFKYFFHFLLKIELRVKSPVSLLENWSCYFKETRFKLLLETQNFEAYNNLTIFFNAASNP
jgi:hypothetical protein